MEFWLSTNPQRFIDYMKSTKVEYQAPLKNKFIRALMNQVNLDSVDNEIKALVARYINENNDLISPNEDFTSFFKTNLKAINLKFTHFREPDDDAPRTTTFLELIDFIFGNSLYEINKENLRFLCGGLREVLTGQRKTSSTRILNCFIQMIIIHRC